MACNDPEISGQGRSKVFLVQAFNDLGKAYPELKAVSITEGVENALNKMLEKTGSSSLFNRMIRVDDNGRPWEIDFSEVITNTTSVPYPSQEKGWRDSYIELFKDKRIKDFEHSHELYKVHVELVAYEASQATKEEWANRFVINRHIDRFPNGFISTSVYKDDKGALGGSCNVSACQLDGQAFFYNQNMRKYYCYQCACDHHADRCHKQIQSYDPAIFDLAQNQGYTLTKAQVEIQREKAWVIDADENAKMWGYPR